MGTFQLTIALLVLITILIVLGGLLARRRYDVAYTFTFYLAVVFGTDLLAILWPGTFYKKAFFLHKENALNALRFGVGLELMYRTFRAFPAAHRTARAVVLVVLCLTLVAAVGATPDQADAHNLVTQVQPRVLSATVWLFTALAALILWYRLPVESFHKAILLGWVPYLLIFSAALNYVGEYGPQFITITNYVHTLAYLGLLAYWARSAWAPASVQVSSPAPRSVVLERKAS
jgi:hypothetical protein